MPERDYPGEAQLAAENHLAAIADAEEALEEAMAENKPMDDWPSSPAMAPWDGCDTCVVREVLFAGWPYAVAEIAEWLANDQGLPEVAELARRKFRIEGEPEVLATKDELLQARRDIE